MAKKKLTLTKEKGENGGTREREGKKVRNGSHCVNVRIRLKIEAQGCEEDKNVRGGGKRRIPRKKVV